MEFVSINEDDINNNHGWQKVTYAKKQRKAPAKQQPAQPVKTLANGSSISTVDNVFTSIEKKSEERRKLIEAEQLANSALYDPVPVRSSKKKNNYSDYDDSDDDEVVVNGAVGNGVVEEKKTKPKKVKKPKVSLLEAGDKIDADDLNSFLSDVTVNCKLIMPRKPTRRGSLQKPQPGLSRLARLTALVTSARKGKKQNDKSTQHKKVPHSSTCSRVEKRVIKEAKKEISPSSSDSGDSSSDNGDSSSDNDDSSSDNDDSSSFDGVVQADFAFFDPKPDDFHGVKVLLQNYLDDKEWDLSSFVELILQQTTVGTVIKIEDDEDNSVYGFVSALNLHRYKDCKCMMEVKEFLIAICPDIEINNKLKSYFGEEAADVGLLISQHVVNLPPQLLPPMYDGLFDEISWATEDEPTKELRKSFCFKYYLLVSKIYKRKNGDQKKKGSSSSDEEAIIYLKVEDEIFHNLSAWSFTFPLHAQQVTTNELKGYRAMGLVMAVEATSVSNFRQQLHSLIED